MKRNLTINQTELITEWNWEKNNSLNFFPDNLTTGSNKVVWWKCKKCFYEWKTSIQHRTNKSKPTNCPKCSAYTRSKNRVAKLQEKANITITNPEILTKWNYEKNVLSPQNITKGSHKKIWWKCKHGHEWASAVGNIIKGHGCPYCSGRLPIKGINDLNTINPKLSKEWNYDKNKNFTPQDVTFGSTKKVWWICKNGHEWQASICNRNKNRGCPICSKHKKTSIPEKAIYFYLSNFFRIEENIKINNQMELDLFIPKLNLGIEYDGAAWHKDINRDIKKDEFCKKNNINLIRIREKGLPKYASYSHIINTQKPDSELKHMQPIIKNIIEYINNEYNFNISLNVDIKNDYFSILSLIEKFNLKNSLSEKFPNLIKEWNFNKNGNLNPSTISKGSSRKVWWICEKGHEWKTSISNRTNDKNMNQCPYCQRKKTIIGENDIVTLNSKFLIDWDYNKNKISPNNFMEHSGIKVWWKCHKCGNEWQATIDSRSKHKCKHCSLKEVWKKRVKKVRNIDTGEIFNSSTEASLKYNIKRNLITRVCNGERKTTGGYHWEYLE